MRTTWTDDQTIELSIHNSRPQGMIAYNELSNAISCRLDARCVSPHWVVVTLVAVDVSIAEVHIYGLSGFRINKDSRDRDRREAGNTLPAKRFDFGVVKSPAGLYLLALIPRLHLALEGARESILVEFRTTPSLGSPAGSAPSSLQLTEQRRLVSI
ncbi:hypothetical protein FRC12_016028 [Ceratobasidium sp. 428]|nr:hypothetical protein FRC12_016028 [Ceratobasidium sp. 428]